MRRGALSIVLALAAVSCGTDWAHGAGPSSASDAAPAKPASGAADARKQLAKPVDINSASAEELKTLPGIGDAEAAQIIAGRPFSTKAQLVTKNIVDIGQYQSLKQRVVASQPHQDGTRNAARYRHRSP